MDLLALREHSQSELTRKLKRKGHDPALVAEVIDRLVAENLLSDARYCEDYAQSRVRRGDGPRKIRQALKTSGVADRVIHETLTGMGEDWVEQASKARVKRFGEPLPESVRERARQSRFLEQRGFTHEQIQQCLQRRR